MSLREKEDSLPLMNEKIPFPRVQLISHEGKNLGEVSRSDALYMAQLAALDLVIIADSGALNLPVAKVMDFGKASYAKKKQQTEAKKSQKVIQVKEVQVRPKIGEHDYQTKLSNAVKFLLDGKRVKITLVFKGREVMMKNERGTELFDKVQTTFDQAGLTKRLVQEKDTKSPQLWSRVYYLKA
jgi:translation initiation factor IF-3